MKCNIQYFAIAKERQEYLGVRFFRWDMIANKVTTVVIGPAPCARRGRSDNFGIYHISTATFFANYLAMKYAVPCSKHLFEKSFKLTVSALKA